MARTDATIERMPDAGSLPADHARVSRTLAHDISNLLTGILGQLSLAERDRDGLLQRDEIAAVRGAAVRAGELCRAILLHAHSPAGSARTVDLAAFASDLANLIRAIVPVGLLVSTSAPPVAVMAHFDDTCVRQILVGAAVQLRERFATGALRISVHADDEQSARGRAQLLIALALTSEGEGIASDASTWIEGVAGRLRNVAGGWDAAVSRRAFDAGTAAIDVDCRLVARSHPALRAARTSSTPSTVLVAEDFDLIRGLIVTQLRQGGYHPLAVSDGDAFLRLLDEQGPAVCLMIVDLDLPGRRGDDCIREIRGRGDRRPVLIITGQCEVRDALETMENVRVLLKPFAMDAFDSAVRECLSAPALPGA